jgi:hypothetical protein
VGTVIVAVADFDGSATEVAVMLAVRLLVGQVAGALYATDAGAMLLSVPAPLAGKMLQVTPRLFGSLLTVAVMSCALPAPTVAEAGDTETEMGAGGVAAICCPPPHPKLLRVKARPTRIPASPKRLFEFMAVLPFPFSPGPKAAPLLSPYATFQEKGGHNDCEKVGVVV